ncbi:MAG TPA: hypothetical protein VGO58_15420, partial [Chitinophagaceae bacterium]|nr:hypothetical protein [Chitinophagaceae bacterium]
MFYCDNLQHPFQNDPGVSQRQRVIDDLLSDNVKIDGRSMADLLQYILQLSKHINYYDSNLEISDWRPLFRNSLPFLVASINNFDTKSIREKFKIYSADFLREPSVTGLQLQLSFVYHNTLGKINTWHLQMTGKGLHLETILQQMMGDKLRASVRQFLQIVNTAAVKYGVRKVNLLPVAANEAWQLTRVELG